MAFHAKELDCNPKVALHAGLLEGRGRDLPEAWQALWTQDRDADAQAICALLAQSQRSAVQAALLIHLARRHFDDEERPAQAWLAWAMHATGLSRRTIFTYSAAAECLAANLVQHVALLRLDLLCLSVLNTLTPPQIGHFLAAHPRPEDLSRDELLAAVQRIKGLPPKAAKLPVQLTMPGWEALLDFTQAPLRAPDEELHLLAAAGKRVQAVVGQMDRALADGVIAALRAEVAELAAAWQATHPGETLEG